MFLQQANKNSTLRKVSLTSRKDANLAEKIIEKAQESSVPIHRDDKLADTLSRLDIGEMIPPELYEVVAEILVFVDAVDHRMVKESAANGGKQKI